MRKVGSPAAAYLESLIRSEPSGPLERERRGLAPVRELLKRLDNPHHGLRCVHIAGSKGKGSTALLMEAGMQALGFRTGTYTSPHLERWTERFRLGGSPISEHLLDHTLERIRPHVEGQTRKCPDLAPSFFDVLSAAAFLIFRDARVDRAILETGLGGRLDATNVALPDVTCITSIEREHTARLGTQIPRIAREKAGILKEGVPLVMGRVPAAAERVIRARAGRKGAEVFGIDTEIGAICTQREGGCLLEMPVGEAERMRVRLHHPALFMAHNAALALACLDRLGLLASAEARDRAARALAGAHIPGRGEVLRRSPWVVVDGAHTSESVSALASLLDSLTHDAMDLVVSLGADKAPAEVLPLLLERARRVYATSAESTRSRPAEALAVDLRRLAPGLEVRAVAEPSDALREALGPLAASDLLCITGSMYLAGAARRILEDDPAAAPCTAGEGASTIVSSRTSQDLSSMNRIDLAGRFAVVTGAAHGIGYAVTERLLATGATVALWDRDPAQLAESEVALGSGGRVLAVEVDVTDAAAVDAAAQRTLDAFGQIDILVNNAGIAGPSLKSWEYPLDEWQRVMDIDLNGVFFCCRSAVPHMRERNYGRIVNVASIAGKEGNPNAAPYSAAKAGVIALTKSIAKETADLDIAVNCITPAAARTRIFDQISQEHIDYMLSKIPRGRFVKVEEIAAMVAWLVSEENSFTTGGVFDLSGGRATY